LESEAGFSVDFEMKRDLTAGLSYLSYRFRSPPQGLIQLSFSPMRHVPINQAGSRSGPAELIGFGPGFIIEAGEAINA
jgi:hypothetical protein